MSYKRKKIGKSKKLRVFEEGGWMCAWCFSPYDLTIDHIVPIAKGGTNAISNLMPLCGSCNIKKGSIDGSKASEIEHIRSSVSTQAQE